MGVGENRAPEFELASESPAGLIKAWVSGLPHGVSGVSEFVSLTSLQVVLPLLLQGYALEAPR